VNAAPTQPAVDESKLASLAKAGGLAPVPKPDEATKPTTPADLDKANEKLSSLLGKKP
jgi:hypothetical protein